MLGTPIAAERVSMASLFAQMKNALTGDPQKFFDSFSELAGHAVSCARRMEELARGVPEESEECERIHAEEAEADAVSHRVIEHLNESFVPPLDAADCPRRLVP